MRVSGSGCSVVVWLGCGKHLEDPTTEIGFGLWFVSAAYACTQLKKCVYGNNMIRVTLQLLSKCYILGTLFSYQTDAWGAFSSTTDLQEQLKEPSPSTVGATTTSFCTKIELQYTDMNRKAAKILHTGQYMLGKPR